MTVIPDPIGQRMSAEWTYDKIGLRVESWLVNKFGAHLAVDTTSTPLALNGNYQTPETAKILTLTSDDAADAVGGLGAQTYYCNGLGGDGVEIEDIINMNGLGGANTNKEFLRAYRAFPLTSGTYATQIAMSQVGTVKITSDAGANEWAEILPDGQSQIGVYSIGLGLIAYIFGNYVTVDSNKAANIKFFKRSNILDVVAPYSGVMRLNNMFLGASGFIPFNPEEPIGVYDQLTDIGFMSATALGTAEVTVDFNIVLVKREGMQIPT